MEEKREKNTKKKAQFSLDGIKEAREGGVSRLDQLELEDEEDVYELVDDTEYEKIVQNRRQGDDFVVDDNGLGYHDDGEEHLGVGEDAYDAKKRMKEATREGDSRLSKKARRLAESSQQAGGPRNSILRHMQAGMSGASAAAGTARAMTSKKSMPTAELDIDSLLGSAPAAPSRRALHGAVGGGGGGGAGLRRPTHAGAIGAGPGGNGGALFSRRRFPAAAAPSSAATMHQQKHYGDDDYGADAALNDFGHHEDGAGAGGGFEAEDATATAAGLADDAEARVTADPTPPLAASAPSAHESTTTAVTSNAKKTGAASEEVHEGAQPPPPSQQPQKLSLSKGTRKLKASEPLLSQVAGSASSGGAAAGTSSVWGFKPELNEGNLGSLDKLAQIDTAAGGAGAATAGAGASAGVNKIDPHLWLLKRTLSSGGEEKSDPSAAGASASTAAAAAAAAGGGGGGGGGEQEDYVNMFWLDAAENNGLIYLFGKLPVAVDAQQPHGEKRFVSCCVVVHGAERNLFVLPRSAPDTFREDGSQARLGMADVYKELSALLVPNIVPRTQGQTFRCKGVKRRYAFEHGEVPREETEYLKVVYSAKHGAPSTTQCEGGKTYERIFGASSSPLELFLLKRKLMGPCWITIRRPKLNPSVVSWCRVEIAVESPKHIQRASQEEACGPAPPLTSLSISIKTAVNPVTHMHEVIMLSGVVHSKIECDADAEMHAKHQRRFTFIRQLGVSCGNNYPSAFPHDLHRALGELKFTPMTNERALLSAFFARVQNEDPDVLCSHNLLGFECDVILARAIANKLPNWSLLGRLRKSKPPRSINDRDVAAGRILCDTYKAAKEFLRETTYSLTHLAQSQLKHNRVEVDPVDVPKYFSSTQDIVRLALANTNDAMLVQGLMLKLQVIPLTKQLTNLSGNLWSRTIRGARAERIEYLLLHEFHALKYVLPEKKAFENSSSKKGGGAKGMEDEEDDAGDTNKVGGMSRKRAKAAYAGGLVLEPKKGLYDTYILLLDFNSLYPSIIQEYNLCFTTIQWTKYVEAPTAASSNGAASSALTTTKNKKNKKGGAAAAGAGAGASATGHDSGHDSDEDDDNAGAAGDAQGAAVAAAAGSGNKALPPVPDNVTDAGVLPRVIKTLVERRRIVKDMLKKEKDPVQKQLLDIRQKALKLTANSMYGCLGFSFSRFYARPIAALVTAMGREALQRTVDLATTQMSLDVIYGDTDSVMINTNLTDLKSVKEIGNLVKKEVNKLYRALELDLDGIFKSMLLLKKKKYAALVINEGNDGKITYEKEMKGLDLVRRDWCGVSKAAGAYVVEQILSDKPREEIVILIHDYLADLAQKIRTEQIPMERFIVTKGLNKNPRDYPDCSGQAHLQVALQMLKNNKPVNIGDHIPYVICQQGPEGAHAAQRAYHPDDIVRGATYTPPAASTSASSSTSSSAAASAPAASTATAEANSTSSTSAAAPAPPQPQKLTLDYEWYLSTQILPPIARLCEPIEGTSPAILSERLGLDASKYARMGGAGSGHGDELLEDGWGFTPKCQMDDAERFARCVPLTCECAACGAECAVKSVQVLAESAMAQQEQSVAGGIRKGTMNLGQGLSCDNCGAQYFGRKNAGDCYCYMSNRVTLLVRACVRRYYDCWLVCEDPSCQRRTMQQSVRGLACTENCHGRMVAEYDETALHTQLKCLESLFDVPRLQARKKLSDIALRQLIPAEQLELLNILHQHMSNSVEVSAYNWIRPSLWTSMFGKAAGSAAGTSQIKSMGTASSSSSSSSSSGAGAGTIAPTRAPPMLLAGGL